ncbi:MAG: M81 family metallopeptidase [Deltaproteobacteria bacterium]|nr:M81 family metallopeptidase [Deltaproteobacteria bacterium]
MTKIAIGQFAQESHSFSPIPGSWTQFEAGYVLRGPKIIAHFQGTRDAIAGALEVAGRQGTDVVPLMACFATSSGPILQDVFDSLLDELLDRLRAVLPVDGVFMVLHGAMLAEHDDDATGRVLEAIREVVGPEVPVTGSLDLHANVTQKMVDQANVLVGYKTFPHVDMYETAARAMQHLADLIAGTARPVTALRCLPMILPGENGRTTDGPFAEVIAQAIALESTPGVLSASAFSVQPWLDLPDVGCSVLVTTEDDPTLADREAEQLADAFWARRRAFDVQLVPIEEAIARAVVAERGPVIFSDASDAPSSGAPGDSTVILNALLEAGVNVETLINIVDPKAVDAAIRAGVGAEVTLTVGGRATAAFCAPATLTGRVRLIADGAFRFKGPGFHGVEFQRGRTTVVQAGAIFLEIMERPVVQWDPELYRSVGLEPRDARIVVVKSPAGFRAAYAPFAAEIIIVDAPGVCSSNLRSFPWKRIGRPCYPLDEIVDWRERR